MTLDDRKRLILAVMRETSRPIWVEDISSRASVQGSIRIAFRALLADGQIVRERRKSNGRAYYQLAGIPGGNAPPK